VASDSSDIPTPADIETMGYAVTYWIAARALLEKTDWDPYPPIAATMALLCFSLENGLKAVLQHSQYPIDPKRRWDHSHDLRSLRFSAAECGLHLSGTGAGVIDALSPFHKTHLFRYPNHIEGQFPSNEEDGGGLRRTLARCRTPHQHGRSHTLRNSILVAEAGFQSAVFRL